MTTINKGKTKMPVTKTLPFESISKITYKLTMLNRHGKEVTITDVNKEALIKHFNAVHALCGYTPVKIEQEEVTFINKYL